MDPPNSTAFVWHEQSRLCCWPLRNQDATTPEQSSKERAANQSVERRINGTQFIADVDAADTLRALKKVLGECSEFCVHAPELEVDRNSQAQQHSQLIGNANIPAPSTHYFQAMSSGSNGKPKRIRRTQASWLASFHINAKQAGVTTNDSYAVIGKLSHSLSLYAALEAINLGADVHALASLRPDHQLQAMQELGSTILYATPTQLRLLYTRFEKNQLSGIQLRRIYCGGGKLDSRTAQKLAECFPNAVVREFYGATETSFITISDSNTPAGSVGKAYPGVQLRIHHPSLHRQNQLGEIHVNSPYLFDAYIGIPDKPAQWHGDFLSVGEMGYLDERGYLFLAGRQTRRVNIADQLVYPEEIEILLNEYAAVQACAVIPVADEKRGHVLVAVIQFVTEALADSTIENAKLDEGLAGSATCRTRTDKLSTKILIELRMRVGSLKAPRNIVCVEHLPLLASGKPDLDAVDALVQSQ